MTDGLDNIKGTYLRVLRYYNELCMYLQQAIVFVHKHLKIFQK